MKTQDHKANWWLMVPCLFLAPDIIEVSNLQWGLGSAASKAGTTSLTITLKHVNRISWNHNSLDMSSQELCAFTDPPSKCQPRELDWLCGYLPLGSVQCIPNSCCVMSTCWPRTMSSRDPDLSHPSSSVWKAARWQHCFWSAICKCG